MNIISIWSSLVVLLPYPMRLQTENTMAHIQINTIQAKATPEITIITTQIPERDLYFSE